MHDGIVHELVLVRSTCSVVVDWGGRKAQYRYPMGGGIVGLGQMREEKKLMQE